MSTDNLKRKNDDTNDHQEKNTGIKKSKITTPTPTVTTIAVVGEEKKNTVSEEEFRIALSKIPPAWAANMDRILFSEDVIKKRVKEMAAQISKDYAGETVICVGLLKGAFVFLSDMVKHFTVPYEVDFMVVSSYGHGTTSSGSVKLKKDLGIDPSGRHVLILEDLIDTGKTLHWICNHLKSKNAKSVKIAVMLNKTSRRDKDSDVKIDYVGYECEDSFVVGLGMDFAEQYRGLPFVGVLKPEAYS